MLEVGALFGESQLAFYLCTAVVSCFANQVIIVEHLLTITLKAREVFRTLSLATSRQKILLACLWSENIPRTLRKTFAII